jgi:hypothetical protein
MRQEWLVGSLRCGANFQALLYKAKSKKISQPTLARRLLVLSSASFNTAMLSLTFYEAMLKKAKVLTLKVL